MCVRNPNASVSRCCLRPTYERRSPSALRTSASWTASASRTTSLAHRARLMSSRSSESMAQFLHQNPSCRCWAEHVRCRIIWRSLIIAYPSAIIRTWQAARTAASRSAAMASRSAFAAFSRMAMASRSAFAVSRSAAMSADRASALLSLSNSASTSSSRAMSSASVSWSIPVRAELMHACNPHSECLCTQAGRMRVRNPKASVSRCCSSPTYERRSPNALRTSASWTASASNKAPLAHRARLMSSRSSESTAQFLRQNPSSRCWTEHVRIIWRSLIIAYPSAIIRPRQAARTAASRWAAMASRSAVTTISRAAIEASARASVLPSLSSSASTSSGCAMSSASVS